MVRSTRNVRNGDNFFEGDDLKGSDNSDHVNMTGKQRDQEGGDHHEGPYRPGNKGLLLLLVFRWWW